MLRVRTRLVAVAFAAVALVALMTTMTAAGCTSPAPRKTEILVLAASDLKLSFTEIAERLDKEKGIKVKYSFGSTGQLAQQIEAGARADVFAAANITFVDELRAKKLVIPETQALYAIGRLVIWSPAAADFHPARLEELTDPRLEKIAIANPDHAPYGKAAKEALQKAGVWDEVSKKMVLGENASQTFQFGESGNVDATIVPLSLATGSGGTFKLVPQSLHKPLQQSIAVLAENSNEEAAREFVDFVTGPAGREILRSNGFELPD